MKKSLLDKPGAAERFLREIRSAAKLSHDNVVKAYSVVQVGELLGFAMEFVEGEDFAKMVNRQGPLSVSDACNFVQQAARGLQHAHENGMVHRDIKPHNLILSRQGKHVIKILDFGLAKATREEEKDTGLTAEGMILGTPDYMAPEQAKNAARVDIRSDIYSLGCTFYYLLSGQPPFRRSSALSTCPRSGPRRGAAITKCAGGRTDRTMDCGGEDDGEGSGQTLSDTAGIGTGACSVC